MRTTAKLYVYLWLKFGLKLCKNKKKPRKYFVKIRIKLNKIDSYKIFSKFRKEASQEIQTKEIAVSRIKETNQLKLSGVIIVNLFIMQLEINIVLQKNGNNSKNSV